MESLGAWRQFENGFFPFFPFSQTFPIRVQKVETVNGIAKKRAGSDQVYPNQGL